MTTISSTARALRRSAEQAGQAPSVHNTQPWRFVLTDAALELIADRSRQLAVLDPKARQLHISLGCAVLNARASLAAAGRGARVTREPDEQRPDLAARIEILDSATIDPVLAALDPVIGLRRSNRRRFAPDPVPSDLLERLISAASAEGALLHPVTTPEDRLALARLSQAADRELISNASYRAEMRAWTTGDASRTDGVPGAAAPHVDGTAHDDVPMRDFDMSGAATLPAETRSSINQCLLVLGTTVDSPTAWLCAGEALERVWLEITRAGFVASLFTQITEVPALRAQLRSDLRLSAWPHLVLRIGRAPSTPPTPRRPIADLVDVRMSAP